MCLSDLLAVHRSEDCAAQCQVLDALGVQLNDVDVGVLALANLGACLALHSVVAGCAHEGEGIQFAVLEACNGLLRSPSDAR